MDGAITAKTIVVQAKTGMGIQSAELDKVWASLQPFYRSRGADRLYDAVFHIKDLFRQLGEDIDGLAQILDASQNIISELTQAQVQEAERVAELIDMRHGSGGGEFTYSINK
jgi:hypothetical protein